MNSVDNHNKIQVEDIVEHDVDNNQDNTDTCNMNIVKDHNKIQVDDIILQNIDNTCNRNQVQDISHYTTSTNTCNYRLPATNTNKRNEINVLPKQAWKLKVEEFCHKIIPETPITH